MITISHRLTWTQVSNICDCDYVGPGAVLSTLGPLLKLKTINANATLLMLFINAVEDEYEKWGRLGELQRFKDCREVIPRLVSTRTSTELDMIRIGSCCGSFGDFDSVFQGFLKGVHLNKLAKTSGFKGKDKHTIIEPWPFRVTRETTKEEFDILDSGRYMGSARYMEFERL